SPNPRRSRLIIRSPASPSRPRHRQCRALQSCRGTGFLTLIPIMAGLLVIVSATEPGTYAYLKYGVARRNGDVILDRRREDRRRIHTGAAPERRKGDRRHRDMTRELRALGWAVVHR